MKIIVRNSDSVVLYARPDLVLTATEVRGDGWLDPNFTSSSATLVEATLPAGWSGGVWTYIASEWAVHDETQHAAHLAQAAKASVPATVTMRQARLALLAAGLLDDVETAVSGAGAAAAIEWEYAQSVDRDYGLVPAMAAALELTDAQLDALFVAAGAL